MKAIAIGDRVEDVRTGAVGTVKDALLMSSGRVVLTIKPDNGMGHWLYWYADERPYTPNDARYLVRLRKAEAAL